MYIILTSKPGQYRSEVTDGLQPLQSYVYRYDSRHVATFTIAELQRETRVRIFDEATPANVNFVPTKFFDHFDTLEAAFQSLSHLAGASHADAEIVPLDKPAGAS
ncbi:hypothetical protein PQQ53_04990 [Paraburkholderia strydomiana]|jgi:hypothetical protein|uniref:Ferredoxin n=1 Tax=Paraburkholderia strydomiana TaxID=1245417 RepID=A0ABW9E8L1_9BURK